MKPTILRPVFELPVDDVLSIIGKTNQSLFIDIYTNTITIKTIGSVRTSIVEECIKHLLSLMKSNHDVILNKSELAKYIEPWFKNICVESMPRKIRNENLEARIKEKVKTFKLKIKPIADKYVPDVEPDTKGDELISNENVQAKLSPKANKKKKPYKSALRMADLESRIVQLYLENNESADEVSEKLGISRATLFIHLKRLGLSKSSSYVFGESNVKTDNVNLPITLKNGRVVNISYKGKLSDKDIDLIASHLKYLNEE
ncbi:hypothetical protein IGB31_14395 [Pseudomonas putida]|nr:hypothetical protein IGB31_14395 [Pseudomonas putida]